MEKIGEFLSKVASILFDDLSLKARWFAAILIILGFVFVIWMGEFITGLNFYNSLDRRVGLLERLYALEKDGISNQPGMASLYKKTLEEISRREIFPFQIPSMNMPNTTDIIKVLASASIGLFFLFYALLFMRGSERRKVFRGALIATLIFGFLGYLIPYIHPVINFILVPIVLVLLLSLFGRVGANSNDQVNSVANAKD